MAATESSGQQTSGVCITNHASSQSHVIFEYSGELLWFCMMTSSDGNIFRVTALCAGNSPVTGEIPAQRPVTRSFDIFFDVCLDERLSKPSWGWWFETPSSPLWRHSNGYNISLVILLSRTLWSYQYWYIITYCLSRNICHNISMG